MIETEESVGVTVGNGLRITCSKDDLVQAVGVVSNQPISRRFIERHARDFRRLRLFRAHSCGIRFIKCATARTMCFSTALTEIPSREAMLA